MPILIEFMRSFALVLTLALVIGLAPLSMRAVRHSSLSTGALLLLSVGLSYWGGWAYLHRRWLPELPPTDSSHWVLWGLMPCLLFSLWQNYTSVPAWLRVSIRALGGTLLCFAVSAPLQEYEWSRLYSVLFILGAGLVYLCSAEILERLSKKTEQSSALYPALLMSLSCSSAALFLMASSAQLAQKVMMLTLILIVPLIVLSWKGLQAHDGLLNLSLYLLWGLWLQAWLFAYLPALSLWAGLAPLSALILLHPSWNARPHWQGALWVWCLSTLWCGGVVAWVYFGVPGTEIYTG